MDEQIKKDFAQVLDNMVKDHIELKEEIDFLPEALFSEEDKVIDKNKQNLEGYYKRLRSIYDRLLKYKPN